MKNILLITVFVLIFGSCSTRNTGGELPGFIKLVNGETRISNNDIRCRIDLDSLPKTLIFKDHKLDNDFREYEWATYFDTNNDGKYDLAFSLSSWNMNQPEEHKGEILENTQANVWKLSKSGGEVIGNLEAEIKGNSIVLSASGIHELHEINSGSKIKYQTFYNNGAEILVDSLILK